MYRMVFVATLRLIRNICEVENVTLYALQIDKN